jgi:hypothetical protein
MRYQDLSFDQRMAVVSKTNEAPAEAMALDPDPHIIRALFDNPKTGLKHARLAAFHHRNAAGLEAIARRGDLLRDSQVQRLLLRNPQTPENLVRRILQPRRLLDVYKATLDRDIPDRTRGGARNVLRRNFTQAGPEDRFQLIWSTEARVLATLVGCTLDSRTTAMICGKPITSVMLVRILAHCLKQNFVRKHSALKKMCLQHPNCPSDAKRL